PTTILNARRRHSSLIFSIFTFRCQNLHWCSSSSLEAKNEKKLIWGKGVVFSDVQLWFVVSRFEEGKKKKYLLIVVDNLNEEFALIHEIVDTYNYVAMDTDFPGVVLRPVGTFKNINDYNYQTLKGNVDMLKLIQLGLTFSDENRNLSICGTDSFCICNSIELLRQCGIDFKKNNEKGIDVKRFGELLMSSGIMLNDDVHWVTFYTGFFDLIKIYFPMVYDIKHMKKFCNSLHGGLNKLTELWKVERVGVCHQAGSDSLLTSCTFRKLRDNFFNSFIEKYAGVLYGLGVQNGQNTN
ncbi:hypothetical protein ES288_A08G088500v1, partial [Gossypium darwinii]